VHSKPEITPSSFVADIIEHYSNPCIGGQSGSAEELEANLEMSSLVNYIQPARFHSFDYAESEQFEYLSSIIFLIFTRATLC